MTSSNRFSSLRRRMRANATRGSAAIEFALVAPVFFALLFGIIESGIMYFGQFTLQNAVNQAARKIRTGQAQGTAFATAAKCTGSGVSSSSYSSSQQWFTDQICCGISVALSCDTAGGRLHVSVQSFSGGFGSNFASTGTTDASGKTTYTAVTDAYAPGAACDVVLVRATYSWPVVTPVLSWFLSNMAGNNHLLSATTAFRNEPYSAGSAGC